MTSYISTCLRPDESILHAAKTAANQLDLIYVERGKRSIQYLQEEIKADLLIMGKNRVELYPLHTHEPIFFHPSSAMFRIKRLERGETDPFIEVSQLKKGDSLLDCTLGLGSDSLVAAFQVGETGKVVGLEADKLLFFVVKEGFKNWQTEYKPLQQALKRVQIENTSYMTYLAQQSDRSFDCVYFDPMFEYSIEESEVMRKWEKAASFSRLNVAVIEQAKRVARRRVVVKAHYRSNLFEELGFTKLVRKSAKFHFGYIDVS